jgi:hypothetical protein
MEGHRDLTFLHASIFCQNDEFRLLPPCGAI